MNLDIKTYLFDFDGTLVDSMPTFISTMIGILEENKIAYPDNIVKIITPLGLEGTANYFINKLGLKMPKEDLMNTLEKLYLWADLKKLKASHIQSLISTSIQMQQELSLIAAFL